MALLLHSCAGRVGYATELRAATVARSRRHATWVWCNGCGRWHVHADTRRARAWAAICRVVGL